MAIWVHLAETTQNAMCNAAVDLIDGGTGVGKIKYYDGTAPATVDTPVSTQTLLGTHTFADPAFGDAADGTASVNTVTGGNAVWTSTATWARITDSSDNALMDVSVGTTGCVINLTSVSFVSGQPIPVITSGSFTMPSGT